MALRDPTPWPEQDYLVGARDEASLLEHGITKDGMIVGRANRVAQVFHVIPVWTAERINRVIESSDITDAIRVKPITIN